MAKKLVLVEDQKSPKSLKTNTITSALRQTGAKELGATGSKLRADQNKVLVTEYVKRGYTIQKALDDYSISRKTYEYWRRSDEIFKEQIDKLRGMKIRPETETIANREVDFPSFCEQYLDTKLFTHHLQWLDLLEGRDPRDLHPAQIYKAGEPEVVIVNTPPEHAKSTTITVNYVTYRICQDPNVRIIIVSKTSDMAVRFLRAVKDRLTSDNPSYTKLQTDFAPEGGFNAGSAAWKANEIYVSSGTRDSGEPSPTVRALGIRGQIYGSRADLIIMDDCVDMSNAHEYEKQIDWIQNEIMSRLAVPGGKLLLVGTRLQPVDLYSEIQKPEYYADDEESPWTYLTQPAVLETADLPEDWVTLWPRTNRPPVSLAARKLVTADSDGLYPMWDGPSLNRKRSKMSPRNWAMVYQQQQVVDDSIFPVEKVVGCIDGMRRPGPMVPGAPGHRQHGMEGLFIVGGFDPAMTGHSAAVILGIERHSGVRWVLDTWTKGHCKPDDIFDKIKELTLKHRVQEWRIEKNAMNLMVTQNRDIRTFLANRGCLLKEHFTGKNKWDADFGVASMSMLFDGHESGKNLIRLPSRSNSESTKALVEQLTTWFPETKAKTDLVMALWFAEIRAREITDEVDNTFTIPNRYRSLRDNERTVTFDLDAASAMEFQRGGLNW